MQVPTYWIVASFIYFFLSILWSVGLIVGVFMLYKKTMPLLNEAQAQMNRVSETAKSVAAKAAATAEVVHVQTQRLLGNADSTTARVTSQARTIGSTLTGLLVAAKVAKFVRKVL